MACASIIIIIIIFHETHAAYRLWRGYIHFGIETLCCPFVSPLLLLYFILCLQPLGYGILEYMTWVSNPYSALVSSVSHHTFCRGPPLCSPFLVHCQLAQSGSHSSL